MKWTVDGVRGSCTSVTAGDFSFALGGVPFCSFGQVVGNITRYEARLVTIISQTFGKFIPTFR